MNILLYFQEIRNPVFDVIFKLFTLMGEQYFIIAVFCILAWCGDKSFAHKTGFAFCLGMGINQVVKLVFCIQRPWILDKRILPSEYALEGATGYSFPSGHTQSGVTFFGCFTGWFEKKQLKIICIVCALGVGISRMYFGVHTLADVTVSFLIGVGVIFVADALYGLCEKHDLVTLVSGVTASFAMVLFAIFKAYPPYHTAEYAYDCIKMAGAIGGFVTGWFLEGRFVNYQPAGSRNSLAVKTIIGLLALVVLKLFFKTAFEQTYFIMYLQNFTLILWCIVIYPWILNQKGAVK